MPPTRTGSSVPSRRSRRLSAQEPIILDDGWESSPGELSNPDSDPKTSSSLSPAVLLAPISPARRASHSRKRSEHHIPRPPNPFVCFRSNFCEWNKQLGKAAVSDQRLLSKLAGRVWHALSSAEHEKYEDIAEEKKKLHAEKYPDYAYSPTSRSGGKGKKRKADGYDYEKHIPQSKRRRSRADLTQPSSRDYSPSPTDLDLAESFLAATARSSRPESDRPQTPELSPNCSNSSESPDTDTVLRTPAMTLLQTSDDDDFIPTADIPALDLYDSEKKIEPPRSCFKPDIPRETRDLYMWYTIDGSYTEPAATASNSVVDNLAAPLWPINYGEVQFTNPFAPSDFEFELGELIHLG